MEPNAFKVFLSHTENISAVGKENIPAVFILGHILILALLEVFKLGCVITLYPACFIQMNRLPTALGVIFVLKAILNYLELELSHRSYYLPTVKLVDKQLRHTFIHQLVYSLLKLLRLHWIGILNIFEHLGRETRQAAEM